MLHCWGYTPRLVCLLGRESGALTIADMHIRENCCYPKRDRGQACLIKAILHKKSAYIILLLSAPIIGGVHQIHLSTPSRCNKECIPACELPGA